MKMGSITTTNQKGQIVIPAALRSELAITDQVPLHITLKGNAIYIVPIRDFVTVRDSDNSYVDLLKKTQGTWKGDHESRSNSQQQLELEASQKRKQPW